MTKTQRIGIGIIAIAIAMYFFIDITIIKTLSGILSAIGLGFILKWIPFKKQI